jgi:hypothetical protein
VGERRNFLRPLQKSSLAVAAVCDRRDFEETSLPTALTGRRYRIFAGLLLRKSSRDFMGSVFFALH